jgi:hypothetical protein
MESTKQTLSQCDAFLRQFRTLIYVILVTGLAGNRSAAAYSSLNRVHFGAVFEHIDTVPIISDRYLVDLIIDLPISHDDQSSFFTCSSHSCDVPRGLHQCLMNIDLIEAGNLMGESPHKFLLFETARKYQEKLGDKQDWGKPCPKALRQFLGTMFRLHVQNSVELKNVLLQINDSLPDDMQLTTPTTKRGLVNAVGSAFKYLFGVSTEKDDKKLANRIAHIERFLDNTAAKSVTSQNALVSGLKIINNRISNLVASQQNAINQTQHILESFINKQEGEISFLYTLAGRALSIEANTRNLITHMTQFLHSVEFLSRGGITRHLVSTDTATSILNLVQNALSTNNTHTPKLYIVAKGPRALLHNPLYSYMKIQNKLVITLTVFLSLFNEPVPIYKFSKIPLQIHSEQKRSTILTGPSVEYFALSSTNQYLPLTERQVLLLHLEQQHIFETHIVSTPDFENCAIALIRDNAPMIRNNCRYDVINTPSTPQVWELSTATYLLQNQPSYTMTCDFNLVRNCTVRPCTIDSDRTTIQYTNNCTQNCIIYMMSPNIPVKYENRHENTHCILQTDTHQILQMRDISGKLPNQSDHYFTLNLPIIYEVYDLSAIKDISAEQMIPQIPEIEIKMPLAEAFAKNFVANDHTYRVDMERIIKAAKVGTTLHYSSTEALMEKIQDDLEDDWTFIVVLSNAALTVVILLVIVYFWIKLRKIFIILLALQFNLTKLQKVGADPILLRLPTVTPDNSVPETLHQQITSVSNEHWQYAVLILFALYVGKRLSDKIYRTFWQSLDTELSESRLVLNLQGANSKPILIGVQLLIGQPPHLEIHSTNVITGITVEGYFRPKLIYSWNGSVYNVQHGTFTLIQQHASLTFREAWLIRHLLKHRYGIYSNLFHQYKLFQIPTVGAEKVLRKASPSTKDVGIAIEMQHLVPRTLTSI